jgi:hypothetical protein
VISLACQLPFGKKRLRLRAGESHPRIGTERRNGGGGWPTANFLLPQSRSITRNW